MGLVYRRPCRTEAPTSDLMMIPPTPDSERSCAPLRFAIRRGCIMGSVIRAYPLTGDA